MMGFMENYDQHRKTEKIASDKQTLERKSVEDQRKIKMLNSILEQLSIKKYDVSTNGYWYYFEYNNMNISIVDQKSRAFVTAHNPFKNPTEEECFNYCRSWAKNSLKGEFIDYFNLEEWTIDDDPEPREIIEMIYDKVK